MKTRLLPHRTRKYLLNSFSMLILALIALTAQSQTIFDVELVVFKRIDNQDMQTKISNEDAEVILDEFANSLNLDGNTELFPSDFSLLSREERKLEGVFRRLRSSPNLRPLYHIGWRQELTDKNVTPWLRFELSDEPMQAGVEHIKGKVRFSRNQGLLIETLVLAHKPSEQDELSGESFSSEESFLNEEEQSLANMQAPDAFEGYFLLEESRKIKLNDLHYFDHPNMGILLKVTPHVISMEEQNAINGSTP